MTSAGASGSAGGRPVSARRTPASGEGDSWASTPAVRDVGQNYIATSTTGLAGDIYVPASAIANVEHEVVHLSVPQRDVAELGWEQPPRDDDAPATSPESDLHRHV